MKLPFLRSVIPAVLAGLAASLLLLAAMGPARASAAPVVKVTFDLQNGDHVADTTRVVAHIESQALILKADFYIDDKLRATVTSVPYIYDWDTIADTEGPHVIKVVATDENGATGSASVSLVVDNGLAGGPAPLVARARQALSANDTDTAARYARRALKAHPGDVDATRILATISARSGDYATAARLLGGAQGLDADPVGLTELASYDLRLALQPENSTKAVEMITDARKLRQQAADLQVASARKQYAADNPAAHIAIGDALFSAGHLTEARAEYEKVGAAPDTELTSLNRLALTYVLTGDPQQAENLLRPVQILKHDDPALRAVYALALLNQHKAAEARDVLAADLAAGAPVTLITQCYVALALGKQDDAKKYAAQAAAALPESGDSDYAQALAHPGVGPGDAAVEAAIAHAPFQPGPYLNYAVRVALQNRPDRYTQSLELVRQVAEWDPDNLQASLLESLIEMQAGQADQAKTLLEALYKQDTKEPDLLATLAAYSYMKEDNARTRVFLDQAAALDPADFTIELPQMPNECMRYIEMTVHYHADFFLMPGTLYAQASSPAGSQSGPGA